MENIQRTRTEAEGDAHMPVEITRGDANEQSHDPVVASIRGMLESLDSLSGQCCIYRVPEKLRKLNGVTYTPRVVSIGPIHHAKKEFQAMEAHKLRYLQTFLHRAKLTLEDYVKLMRTWEQKVRQCYAETVGLSSDIFVRMLVLDVSFVVELLWRSHFHQYIDESDRLFHKPMMIDDVARDMILLENQLPFFLLESSLNLAYEHRQSQNPSILKLSYEHFNKLLRLQRFPDSISIDRVKHFLDFLRYCLLPSSPLEWNTSPSMYEFSPSATTLYNSGIRFKVSRSKCLLDIRFKNGVLEIPRIEIDDLTETLLRNLMALEQCHYKDRYIIQYVALISSMVNTVKDAELLVNHRIITSMLGSSDDVSALFNSICKEVVYGHKLYFFSLCQELNAYYRTPWHKWKAALKRDYFSSPWSIVSVIAAVLLLILTFIQAICAIVSV